MPPPPPYRTSWVLLALALAGMALSVELIRLHVGAHAGETSFCAISETVNCDVVAVSSYSVVLGVPVAAWGLLGFAAVAALAWSGMRARRPHATWPAGLLVLASAAAVAASAVLAGISEFAIGAWCLLCAGAWVTCVALLVAASRGLPATGLAAALRADWGAVRARPGASLAALLVALGLAAGLAAAYPRYWARSAPSAERQAAAAPDPSNRAPPRPPAAAAAGESPRSPAAVEVIAYSDYLCPFCARAHEQERALRGSRPDVHFTKRHFPLDQACNPLVQVQMHAGACELARAAICAEAQGRFEEMDDALYRRRDPPAEIARALGLDVERFQSCLASREAAARLERDVALGMRDGITGLPTYIVNGRVYKGALPPELATAGAAEAAPRGSR